MGAIRLGRMLLGWCDNCDLPLVDEGECGNCGDRGRQVEMTPPGDPRPAFPEDLARIRRTIDIQFGEGCGELIIPQGRIVLLNKVPALDRMDEIILGGEVMGALRYDLDKRWTFIMRMKAASLLQGMISRGKVTADQGAVAPIISGKNLLAPGVISASDDIRPGDEIVIVDPEGKAIAIGIARMTTSEMIDAERGVAVKSRWTGDPLDIPREWPTVDWEDVLNANSSMMETRVEEAVRFVKRTMERNDLPAVVSFSGGKDSLACALVCMDAGLRLPLLFIDTTLEFPETVDYVERFASEHDLDLIVGRAREGIFLESVGRFGPPGRDFRWCCKTNKLGPTVRTINERFPGGVLSFIGQRRYESESRSEKPRVWTNPWVPGQVGAAPLQHWTSMHVWTYIFLRGAEYNPWYARGMDRLGCYLCPASDLGEQEMVESRSEDFQEWKGFLQDLSSDRGLPPEWVDCALWRWRRVPGSVRQELSRLGVELDKRKLFRPAGVELSIDSRDELVRGHFTSYVDEGVLANLLNMMDEVTNENGIIDCGPVTISGGKMTISKDEEDGQRAEATLLKIAKKASGCVGCGLCIGKCENGALHLEDEKIRLSEDLCIHCGRCIEPCPALTFGEAEFEL
jgi:phosphoadenosine phosphosulfate reductase